MKSRSAANFLSATIRGCSSVISKQTALAENNAFLLTLLVCPLSKEELKLNTSGDLIISPAAKVAFPLTKGGHINLTVHDAFLLESKENE
jgi:hypothetical protein